MKKMLFFDALFWAHILAFGMIPLCLSFIDELTLFYYMNFLHNPFIPLVIFTEALVLSAYALKTMDTKLSHWKRTLLSIMAMVSIVGILVQLFWIFMLS
jgi:hypothetical protein